MRRLLPPGFAPVISCMRGRHVGLRDIDEQAVRREQGHSRDLIRMASSPRSRDTGAEGFSNEIGRSVRGERLECVGRRLFEGAFCRPAGAIRITGILHDFFLTPALCCPALEKLPRSLGPVRGKC